MGFAKKLHKSDSGRGELFHLVLIKPTRYDDEGYSIHWHRSPMPSNSLACVLALANDCRDKAILGPDVDICITTIDELSGPVDCQALIREIRHAGGKALVGLVGVQSNQYPRGMDLARQFVAQNVPVCIGGFHVTGSLSMLPEVPPEIAEALDLGISLFLGEAEEGRFAEVIRDAYHGRLQPRYDHRNNLPGLAGEPVPMMPGEVTRRSLIQMTSMDLGRGCPFDCSFCCIINVQGHKSRYRSADDLEKILLENHRNGIYRYFITDDNFARNKNWELLFDRMIEVQRREGFKLKLVMQVDMLCHKVKGFIEKASAAGAELVFCGLESINPDNLKLMKKPQNRIAEYREMLLQWKKHNVLLTGGYIMGLPNDTRESILRDIDTIKRELPIDMLYFSIITPLPGSRDHKEYSANGVWMDPDLNNYDLTHVVFNHQTMSAAELKSVYNEAIRRFFTHEHMQTVMRRFAALGGDRRYTLATRFKFYGLMMVIHDLYSLDAGLFRVKYRRSRRPGYATEGWFRFYSRYFYDILKTSIMITTELNQARRTAARIWKEVARDGYRDQAIAPQGEDTLAKLGARTKRKYRPHKSLQPAR